MISRKSKPDNLPEIVYKYRTWEDKFHKRILTNNELYMASPKLFNDPFDCRIPPDFIHLSENEANQYMTDLFIRHFYVNELAHCDMAETKKKFESRFMNRRKFQKEAEKLKFAIEDESYGILSLCTIWNGILLWSHYANHHRGFCVGFWTEKLANLGTLGRFGPVDYKIKFPSIKPVVPKEETQSLIQAFIQTHTKSINWEYEEEFRFVNIFEKDRQHLRTIQFPDDVFAEVILGISISESDKINKMKVCSKKGIPVFQTKKRDFKFRIDRVKVV